MLESTIEQERKTLADTGIIRGRLEGDINVLREQIKSIQSNEAHLLQRKENMSGQVALKEAEEILDGDGELIILSVVEDEDGETYLEPIEDEALFNEIGAIFEERLADYFEFDEE
mgnify:CR=1 FL=1